MLQERSSLPNTTPLDPNLLPHHVAIIMDGNGRWANQKKQSRNAGHQAGTSALKKIIKECLKLNIPYLSVYAFSTENWKRPKVEIRYLMTLLNVMILKETNALVKQQIRVKIIGNTDNIPNYLIKNFNLIEKKTAQGSKLQLNLMVNYGSRDEILTAIKKIKDTPSIQSSDITESLFNDHLLTADIPDPDLLIRTSGESRISNYMLWQLSYTELIFTDTLWPDFNATEFNHILQTYQQRHRRYGGL